MWQSIRLHRPQLLRAGSFCLDLIVAALAFLCAYIAALGFDQLYRVPGLLEKISAFAAVSGVSFFIFSVHRGSWRYVSIPDLIALIKASVLAVGVYTVGAFLVSRGDNVPRSVPILTGFFLIAGLSGIRLAYRLMVDGNWIESVGGYRKMPNQKDVLLYGFTHGAETFIRTTKRQPSSPLRIVGILDDSPRNRSRSVQGVHVYGGLNDLAAVVKRLKTNRIDVDELVVTERLPGRQKLSEILELATAVGIKLSRIPDVTQTASITSSFLMEPKPIELGDLLGRPEVVTDVAGVAQLISGRIVLATGAGGSIGSELCRQIALFNPRLLIITDSSEFHLYMLDKELREAHLELPIITRLVNVRDDVRVGSLFREFTPEVVFHAAALKHVPLVEDNPLEAVKTNVLGTRNVANAAMASKASTFVMISTDKAVNPTNVMGATKRAAEAYCQSLDVVSEITRFKTVRFGNVLGSNGSVVPRFEQQIAVGGPVTVTHPHIVRYFMTIPEAVRLVLHASGQALKRQAERGKIMVLDMGKPVRIVDLAERMIQLAGFKPRIDIEIVFTGLRPGEKLYEELFDPSEVLDGKTEEGYVVASPRVIDSAVLHRTLSELESAVNREDYSRTMALLSHIVPEYRKDLSPDVQPADTLETELGSGGTADNWP